MRTCKIDWGRHGPTINEGATKGIQNKGSKPLSRSRCFPAFFSHLTFVCLIGTTFPALLFAATKSPKQKVIPNWSRFEQSFVSTLDYTNALQEAKLAAVFTSPAGETRLVEGFWDGGRVWRIRFCPDIPGQWTYSTTCSDSRNYGLDGQTGKFLCTAPVGETLFERHGPIRVAPDRRHFEHADGRAFFWIADTVWAGGRLSQPRDWERYALIRSSQTFNAALWNADPQEDYEHESGLVGFPDHIGINPGFFQRLDEKLTILSREGILSVIQPFSMPITGPKLAALPADQAVLLFRYLVARWGADPIAWAVDIRNDVDHKLIEQWKKIGSAVFTNGVHAPVLVVSADTSEALRAFSDQPWVDAFGLDPVSIPHADQTRLQQNGPVDFPYPVVVLAPPENGMAVASHKRFNPDEVRHSLYQNLLKHSPAGVVYSAEGVINWSTAADRSAQRGSGTDLPLWEKSLFLPAAKQLRPLSDLMHSIDFWRLRPCADAVPNQSDTKSIENQVLATSTSAKDLTLLYLTQSAPVNVYVQAMPASPQITWLEPRQGYTRSAVAVVSGATCQFPPPGAGDWVLLIKSGK